MRSSYGPRVFRSPDSKGLMCMSQTPITREPWSQPRGFVPRTTFDWRRGSCGGRAGTNITVLVPGGTTNKR